MSWARRLKNLVTGRKGGVTVLADRYPQYQIGRGSYGDLSILSFGEDATFRMGAYCSVARGAQVFLGGEHRTDWVTTFPFSALDARFSHIKGHPHARGDVVIGNDVWLGRESVIMSGITVGDGAVVAARALVTKDVPPYGIVGGNPAKLIRTRFPPEIVERLLAVAWWTWPRERVEAAVPLLLDPDIEAFLDAAEKGRI